MNQQLDFSMLSNKLPREERNKIILGSLIMLGIGTIVLCVLISLNSGPQGILYGKNGKRSLVSALPILAPLLWIIYRWNSISMGRLRHFCDVNGFKFGENTLVLENTEFETSKPIWNNVIYGTYKGRYFKLGIADMTSKSVIGRFNATTGLLEANIQIEPYNDLELATTLKEAFGRPAKIRRYMGRTYIIISDGLNRSPDGMRKMFNFIEAYATPSQ